jgi:hypothetical protein
LLWFIWNSGNQEADPVPDFDFGFPTGDATSWSHGGARYP